ncbi:hypothetical protein J6TS2_37320 [Heyndrickxia sporothermodurans]|nr:hypothetical protein J6TS2_37320 [Heyndrickxia sporothermodurans]
MLVNWLKSIITTINFESPVYCSEIKTLTPFKSNKETTGIKLWDLIESIGYIDELDLTLLKHIKFLF